MVIFSVQRLKLVMWLGLLEMGAQECERMGGQLVGNDCDDPDIICEVRIRRLLC